MIDMAVFGDELTKLGFTSYTGVPCSYLAPMINYAINHADFILAANEGESVAIASGAYLAGKKVVVLMQNSGISNASSPLSSLNYCFDIPVMGFVSLRGDPKFCDEPQHELTGVITENLLSLLSVEWAYLSNEIEVAREQIAYANLVLSKGKAFFFIVMKGVIADFKLDPADRGIPLKMATFTPTRFEVLSSIVKLKRHETALLATTGKTGRELFEVADMSCNFYMVGSMGCISAIGLGIALNSNKKVISIDGDAAFIMRMGQVIVNGRHSKLSLLHILLDNNAHDSTGGQQSLSDGVNFVDIAKCCGYPSSYYVDTLEDLENIINSWYDNPHLTFLHVRIQKGSKENLGRPTVTPKQVRKRFSDFLASKF